MKRLILTAAFALGTWPAVFAQAETLTNATIVEMTKVGLDRQIIVEKIDAAATAFDVSAAGLIELKKAGVADEVIRAMLDKSRRTKAPAAVESPTPTPAPTPEGFSENTAPTEAAAFSVPVVTAKDALLAAKTVAIQKSSLNPSRQALEKALLKRAEWREFGLTLVRYKEDADLYIEIGRIPFSWLTHRYVFRLYDRRSGTIVAAGETTSWGSLAENMAREITQKMRQVAPK